MTAATTTLKARVQRIAPYFAGTRRGFVLVVIGAIVSALTEPAIPALLKPLLGEAEYAKLCQSGVISKGKPK